MAKRQPSGPEGRLDSFTRLLPAIALAALVSTAHAQEPARELPQTVEVPLAEALDRATEKSRKDDRERIELLDLQVDAASLVNRSRVRVEGGASDARSINILPEGPFRIYSLSAIIAVDYPLYDGGSLAAKRRAAVAEAELLRQRVVTGGEAAERVVRSYADVYYRQQRAAVLSRTAEDLSAVAQSVNELVDTGDLSIIDASRTRERIYAQKLQSFDAELDALRQESELRRLIRWYDAADLDTDLTAELARIESSPVAAATVDPVNDPAVITADLQMLQRQLAVDQAESLRRPRVDLSAYAGYGVAETDIDGQEYEGDGFGIYAFRLNVTVPLFDPSTAVQLETARVELARARSEREDALAAAKERERERLLSIEQATRKVKLLEQWRDTAREREESLRRLVEAGVRRESELADAAIELANRESELLAARVERWKLLAVAELRLRGQSEAR